MGQVAHYTRREVLRYVVSNADYDEYSPRYVDGPAVEDWEAFCLALLPEAARLAVAKRLPMNDGTEVCSWVGAHEIIDALLLVLAERGYVQVRPPNFCICGSNIWMDARDLRDGLTPAAFGGAWAAIVAHNAAVDAGL